MPFLSQITGLNPWASAGIPQKITFQGVFRHKLDRKEGMIIFNLVINSASEESSLIFFFQLIISNQQRQDKQIQYTTLCSRWNFYIYQNIFL